MNIPKDRSFPVALTDLSYPQLQDWLASQGEPGFRAQQLFQWLYVSLEADIGQMANLPAALRGRLSEKAVSSALDAIDSVQSTDGQTTKTLFRLRDGHTIESVLMRYADRQTICVSTQVGCPLACAFCATGQSGFERNLTAGEIIDQVLHFSRLLKTEDLKVTNVVFMGMGEPLLNYEATWQAVESLHDPSGFALGARKFTISTVGVVPGIERLRREELQVGLAVSLHAPDNELRTKLVPMNAKFPLEALIPACRRYAEHTGRRVTFEYALIHKVNDEKAQARALVGLIRGLPCHVNLIPLNPSPGSDYKATSRERVVGFQRELRRAGIPNSLRLRRGIDIQAGCGQLASKHQANQDAKIGH